MRQLSFEDFCDDVLNLSLGLASHSEIEEARISYQTWLSPKKTKKKTNEEKHPDLKQSLDYLIQRASRLVKSQKYAINKFAHDERYGEAIKYGTKAVELGEFLLNKKSTKAEFIAHAEMNSEASRIFNNTTRANFVVKED